MKSEILEYCKSLDNYVSFIRTKIIREIIKLDSYAFEPKRFFYTVLLKGIGSLDSSSLLLKHILEKEHFSDSIILILRTSLSDVITLHYVCFKGGGDESNLKNWIKRLYYDHIEFTEKGLYLYKAFDNLTDSDVGKMRIGLRKKKNEYFDKKGNPTIEPEYFNPRKISPYAMIKNILDNKTEEDFVKPLRDAYPLYEIFSKYEHLGDLTFDLIHRSFDKHELQSAVLEEIKEAISIIMSYQVAIVKEFFNGDEEIINTCELFVSKVNEISFKYP